MPSFRSRLVDALRHESATDWVEVTFAVGLLSLSLIIASIRYFRLLVGSTEIHPDARLSWRPLATAVLDGVPLYLPPATDNKPPLFEFVNILVMETGSYVFVFLVLVSLLNGLSAVLLFRFFAQQDRRAVGAVAAAVFLVAVPVVRGHSINVRSFAVCGFLAALCLSRPSHRGGALAAGALCSQYLVFGVPFVVYDSLLSGRSLQTSLRGIVAAGVAVVAATYGALLAVWGWPSLRASLYWSAGVAGEYFTAYGPSVWIGERAWVTYTSSMLGRTWPLLVVAAVGAVVLGSRLVRGEASYEERFTLGATFVFGSLLLVRPYTTYWMYSLPWIAALAAFGIQGAAFRSSGPKRTDSRESSSTRDDSHAVARR